MPTVRLTCPCGYTWDRPSAATVPGDLRRVCPACAAARARTADGTKTVETVVQSPPQQARSAADSLSPVRFPTIPGFELIGELNRGGMGVIYQARQLSPDRVVALKVVCPQALAVPGARERFEREARAAAALDHPNVVTVYHADLGGPLPYLVMEFVPGVDLLRLVQQSGPLPVAEVLDIGRQAAEGLRHVHERGLVHRDIKPSNLMVCPDARDSELGATELASRVKILDMGVARPALLSGSETGLTEPGVFLGTPDYVAPEQAEDSHRADARSDIFGLGGTLYFLLTGEVPFPGRTLVEKLRKAMSGAPSPAARRPDVPPALDRVVRRMLAADPAARYPTAAAAAAALDGVLRPEPTGNPRMAENYFDRERAAVARLTEAVKARAAAEAELTAAYDTAAEKAGREVARGRKSNAAARAGELGRIDELHAQQAAATARKYDAEQAAADRARDERRATTAEKFRAAEQRGRAEYQDRIWHNDSMLEAGEKAAKDQLESLQRKAAAGAERVAGVWADAEPVLARGRVTRSEIEFAGELPPPNDDDPITRMNRAIQASEAALAAVGNLRSPGLGRAKGFVLFALLGLGIGAAASLPYLDDPIVMAVAVFVGVFLGADIWLAVRWLGRRNTLNLGRELGVRLADAARACDLLNEFAAREYAEERARLSERHARKKQETDDHYLPRLEAQKKAYEAELARIDADHAGQTEKLRRQRAAEVRADEENHADLRAGFRERLDAELKYVEGMFIDKTSAATAARDAAWTGMASAWGDATAAVTDTFAALRAEGADLFPPWDEVARPDRPLPTRVPAGVRCGDWGVDPAALPDGVSIDPRLAPPDALAGPVPAFLPFPDRCSVLLRARDEGRPAAVTALQAMMLRFLTGLPPGKVRFTIIDPVGLGDNFAAFMHLADHDEKLVTSQIWTEPMHIEQRLTDLTDHIASVIQKYLRNQYASIEEYNRAAGEVAEPYRVLVIANFPTNFTPEAAKRLVSIAQSGPSCGVCTLVSADTRLPMPRDFNINDLEAASFTLAWKEGAFVPKDPTLTAFPLVLDRPPDTATMAKIVQRVGKASKDAKRVEVPFEYIAPKPGEEWTGDASKGFEVPVGRAGATRRQAFVLGRGTAQHALVAGKTGSGKSTLLHALITNLALTYSPDEAELYLIDFKEGVEFQWYANYRLPHARVVAIQSEREFGLSVLQRLDGILRERGEKFRDAGVNDLAGYRAAHPEEKTPRILLIVDEFQAFFTEDDKLAQEAALLLDRLVRQGRAFGLHVLLGSQTLGGAYSLARSTIDQMAVRVALQCSDADAQLILSKDNNAARLLSRPGEAIYNDQNGLVEGNDPFQVVWLSEEKREQVLMDLQRRAGDRWPPPLVFSGNSTADPAENAALAKVLESPAPTKAPVAWLGEPIAIKAPTAAVFRPIGGANLLMIGQNEPAARGLFAAAVVGLAAQFPGERRGVSPPSDEPRRAHATPLAETHFTILDGTPDDSDDADYLPKLATRIPGAVAPARSGLPAAIAELAAEMDRRQKGTATDRSPRFLLVFGVHRLRELRKPDDDLGFGRRGGDREPTPAERFAALLRDGPPVGIHVVVWCDSLTNLTKVFDRPQLREFGLRVLFQMSATDSSTLMDTPAASKLGRTRALFLQEDQERAEKFRPYGLPSAGWLDRACGLLRARSGSDGPLLGLNPEPAGV